MATLYESYSGSTEGTPYIRGTTWRGQTFTPSTAHTITSVKILMKRENSPGTATVSIRETSGGLPTGGDLCSGTTNGNTLTTGASGEWREITFDTTTELSASTMYAIVVRAPSGDASNQLLFVADSSSPSYASGNMFSSTNSGSTWSSNTDYDVNFEDWGTPILNTVGPFPTYFKA